MTEESMLGLCPICDQEFTKTGKRDRYCSNLCRQKKKNIQSNANWVVRAERKADPKLNNYLRWGNGWRDQGFLKKFSACRG